MALTDPKPFASNAHVNHFKHGILILQKKNLLTKEFPLTNKMKLIKDLPRKKPLTKDVILA
jgi:hypothetical protein